MDMMGRLAGTLPGGPDDPIGTMPGLRSSPYGLQSTGGQNRFLAIDPEDGMVYSVGRNTVTGDLVEWRPFLCESVLPALPGIAREL